MSWKAIDRNQPVVEKDAAPVLSDAVRDKIRSFFPRYETKRAVLLPALHIVQNTLGYISWQAMTEIAEVLEIHPSDVMNTTSFYTHFWTHPKGEKVLTVCRSISCEAMGGAKMLDTIKKELGIDEHGTTKDGRYSLVTEECLAGCDHAPCLLINEKMHKCVKAEDIPALLVDVDNDKLSMERSDLFDPPSEEKGKQAASVGQDSAIGATSDVSEMREAE